MRNQTTDQNIRQIIKGRSPWIWCQHNVGTTDRIEHRQKTKVQAQDKDSNWKENCAYWNQWRYSKYRHPTLIGKTGTWTGCVEIKWRKYMHVLECGIQTDLYFIFRVELAKNNTNLIVSTYNFCAITKNQFGFRKLCLSFSYLLRKISAFFFLLSVIIQMDENEAVSLQWN